MSVEAIANKIGIDPKAQILDPVSGERVSVASYIAKAADKKAGESGTGSKYNKPE